MSFSSEFGTVKPMHPSTENRRKYFSPFINGSGMKKGTTEGGNFLALARIKCVSVYRITILGKKLRGGIWEEKEGESEKGP